MKRPQAVTLLGLPAYRQGTHDALCTLYSAAILLATLFPEYETEFGQGHRHRGPLGTVRDPLIDCARTRKHDAEATVGRWFFDGLTIRKACALLNRVVRRDGHRTRFIYRE